MPLIPPTVIARLRLQAGEAARAEFVREFRRTPRGTLFRADPDGSTTTVFARRDEGVVVGYCWVLNRRDGEADWATEVYPTEAEAVEALYLLLYG